MKFGTVVKYGVTRGTVIRAERKYGIDGFVVQDLFPSGDPGALVAYPRWIPSTNIERVEEP